MSREVRRVPLDFDWPLNKVWQGYLMPDALDLPACPDCRYDGDHSSGYSPAAYAVAQTFYPHMIGYGRNADRLAWCDKIGQAEVDNLLAEGRLRTWVDGEWQSLPRTAESVNADRHVHDAINRDILVEFRCQRLGIPLYCSTCGGSGEVATDAQRAAHEAWRRTEPPPGEGWQLWETVSEGSPVSSVFPDRASFVTWLVIGYTPVTGVRLTGAQAEAFVDAGSSLGSFVVIGGRLTSGEAAVSEPQP